MSSNINEIKQIEEQQALVERILASVAFQRSPKLSGFLSFICGRYWSGELDGLSEQLIGVTVFGRREGYNPSEDNIVRSQARLLRQKLEAYFEGEGAKERVFLTIAKGAYVPAFVERNPETEAVGGRGKWMWLLATLGLAGALIAGSWLTLRPANDLAKQFWTKVLGGPKPTLIVAGDTSLVLLQDITLQKVRLAEYLSGEYRMKVQAPVGMSEELLRRIARRRYTGIVDASVAAKLSQRSEGKPLVRFARDLRFGEVKGSNLILLGAPHANPWLELYEKDMNFWLDLDLAKANFVVFNRKPQPGEQARYETNQADPRQPIWAVISYLPNGVQGEVLILAGASVAGTEAAAEFLLDDKRMEEFFRNSGSGRFGYFNLLLETMAVDGNSPSSRPVAWRFF